MFPGETILSGGYNSCSDCGEKPELQVCKSAAGYYLGTYCGCGPYSRESHYFNTHDEAEKAMMGETKNWMRK